MDLTPLILWTISAALFFVIGLAWREKQGGEEEKESWRPGQGTIGGEEEKESWRPGRGTILVAIVLMAMAGYKGFYTLREHHGAPWEEKQLEESHDYEILGRADYGGNHYAIVASGPSSKKQIKLVLFRVFPESDLFRVVEEDGKRRYQPIIFSSPASSSTREG